MEPLAHAAPLAGFLGGLMIGTAAAIMLLGVGRIAGVSGLAARASGIAPSGAPRALAMAFILGLPLGALTVSALTNTATPRFPSSAAIVVVGGLLVGFGTRLGSGCTSGHAVCGVSRLSRRSLGATAVFMATGVITVAVTNALGLAW
jgi:uncharacterized membrane protein YedE/YeeE